jgi:hypothetical protein
MKLKLGRKVDSRSAGKFSVQSLFGRSAFSAVVPADSSDQADHGSHESFRQRMPARLAAERFSTVDAPSLFL